MFFLHIRAFDHMFDAMENALPSWVNWIDVFRMIFRVLYLFFWLWYFYRLETFWNEKRRWGKNDRDKRR